MPLSFPDNTANVTVKYGQFNRELAKTHYLTVMISDNGKPALTSTNTLPISICKCNERGEVTFCEASAKIVGVSIQALVAIFVCILTIIGKYLILQMYFVFEAWFLTGVFWSFLFIKWPGRQEHVKRSLLNKFFQQTLTFCLAYHKSF